MKKLLILFTLVFVLTMALAFTSVCFADSEPLPIAQEGVSLADNVEVVEQAQEQETADNNALVWLKETWIKIKDVALGAVSGVTFSTIVAAIMVVVIKRMTNKGFDKIEKATDSTKIAELASSKLEEHFAKTTIDVDIKPLMETQYLLLSQKVYERLEAMVKIQDEKYLAMVKCFEKLSHYYDGSIGVTEAQKEELAEAIAYAESLFVEPVKTTAKIEVVAEAQKPEEKKESKVARPY